jgi:hypothetical protein
VRCVAALTLGLAACGCGAAGDGLPREPVSGKVTIQGEPLAKGAILFKPADDAGQATDAGGLIRDGRYSLGRQEGPVPGTYKVLITEEVDRTLNPTEGGVLNLRPEVKASRISSKYNTRTTLVVTVKPGESNTFDFNLEKPDPREAASRLTSRRR